ncbi:hypothetical protein BU15DRAFT_90336 [Melanogaster broomeanus]|nr:hypothetical protein BU15DRAFT_90336 [Melanogaster broomeanus]
MGVYENTIGTLLIGVFFNTFLYGLVVYQFAAYYRTKFNDRPIIKYMVLFLFILDTFHSASAIYMAWAYTVTNYDNPAALAVAQWPYAFTPIGTVIAALVTQLYLGYRIWRLSSSKLLYAVVVLLAVTPFVLGMVCAIKAWIINVLSELPSLTPLVIAWLTTQVAADMFVTGTLIILLTRSRTGFRKTDTIINRLIRGAIQTGLFASIFAVSDLITFITLPTTNLYGMFAIPIGRIYTNTLLDTLLSREELKVHIDGPYDMGPPNGPIGWASAETAQFTTVQSFGIPTQLRVVQETCDQSSFDSDGKATELAQDSGKNALCN